MEGQEDGPSPLEIFYEKNKKWLIALLVLLVAGTAAKYGLEAMNTAKRNSAWAEFSTGTGLGSSYGTKIDLNPVGEQLEKWQDQIWGMTIGDHHSKQISQLMEDIKSADQAAIDSQITAAKGQAREPWLIWVAANKAYAESRFADARTMCERLKAGFADHLLCANSTFPPQVLKEKEETEEQKKERREKKRKGETIDPVAESEKEYEEPKAGSPVSNLLTAITKDEAFKGAHADFFREPVPAAKNSVVITFADGRGEVEIKFFEGVAKKHVEAFKQLIVDGHYQGMRVHQISRAPKGKDEDVAQTIHFGHPESKQTDRSKWAVPVTLEDDQMLDFEESNISFFPGTVAAEKEKQGEKSSARRFFIAVNDCAGSHDGEYVVFGKVVRGLEVLQDIVEVEFQTEGEDDRGTGIPNPEILLEKTVVTGPDVPEPTPKPVEDEKTKKDDDEAAKKDGDNAPPKKDGK